MKSQEQVQQEISFLEQTISERRKALAKLTSEKNWILSEKEIFDNANSITIMRFQIQKLRWVLYDETINNGEKK